MTQTNNRSDFTPPGWPTVTPRIVAKDAKQLVDFLKKVFDATGEYLETRPTPVKIGDSLIMISESGIRSTTTAFLYVYVQDTDTTYSCAIAAGARSLEEPFDTPYGDRRCMVEDSWGNTWQIATYR
jgi:PhnB protein